MTKERQANPLLTTTAKAILRNEFNAFLRSARSPKLRSFRAFCEQELILPDGPFKGRKFRVDTQPFSRLWLDLVDSGQYSRFATVGPTQSGKTLLCSIAPVMYHLFEVGETVIFGVPTEEMAADKWAVDLRPAIEVSRYSALLPKKGSGSSGGKTTSIQFRNGAVLRFMSGGGKDQKRAGFTARVLVVTEVDGLDVSSEGSREADKLKQLEGRTRAYGSRKRIYLECTASIPTGRIWTEYLGGTETKIVVPCPGCGAWTTPEREHLALWQQADEIAARDEARWICPGCGILWDDSARKQANLQAKTIHRGQMILPDGSIVGDHPRTPTLGFRWNAFNNLLIATADIAADEWRAAKAIDEENATKEMRQFVWAQPYASTDAPQAAIAVELIMRRQSAYQRGQLPPATEMVSVGIDCGKYLCHWAVVAWTTDARGHLIDYGRQEVPSSSMAVGPALRLALRELRDQLTQGWVDPETNTPRPPDIVCVDAGWEPEHIYEHCNDSTAEWWPTKGLGLGQQDQVRYAQPKNTGAVVKEVGDGWHISKLTGGIRLLEFDADHWKSRVHSGLECHVESSGSLVLFQADERDHLSLAKHLTAEERVETFAKGRGSQIAWVRKNRNNHWFDALALAVMGADFQGLEWTPATATPEPKS